MKQIERGILYENAYLGVTVGGLVFPHGTIMIDAPIRVEEANLWRSQLLNQRRGSNRLLILLDSHPDRTLGARTMESTILAHQNTAEYFINLPIIFKGINVDSGALWEIYNEAIGMRWAIPDITFSERLTLHWGEPEVIIEYHPGSSSGAIWVIIPELEIIFVGDTVVLNQPVFLADADLELWLQALVELRSTYKNYRIISGRGGLTDVIAVREQIKYLRKILRAVERLAEREAEPAATEKLIPRLLKGLDYPQEWQTLYEQRLKHGLHQYYSRVYGVKNEQGQSQDEDGK
jgi:glyoxylase-like metal-dependent hydrolase (beta-lactamase superfamily II)